jgi:hypothetical protein
LKFSKGAADAGLSGRWGLAEAPGDYERQRSEETISIYVLKYQRVSLDSPSPEVQQLL